MEITGFEYDWLGCDADGQAAFFSTAGGGYAPDALLQDVDAYDDAIDAILASPATTSARFAPAVAAGCTNTWQLMAERGIYAYDSDSEGGPYRLVAAPQTAALVERLPGRAADVIARVRFARIRFAEMRLLTSETLAKR